MSKKSKRNRPVMVMSPQGNYNNVDVSSAQAFESYMVNHGHDVIARNQFSTAIDNQVDVIEQELATPTKVIVVENTEYKLVLRVHMPLHIGGDAYTCSVVRTGENRYDYYLENMRLMTGLTAEKLMWEFDALWAFVRDNCEAPKCVTIPVDLKKEVFGKINLFWRD